MRIHIAGVCGTAMGSLAGLLKELGHEISGSDVSFDPPMGDALSALQIGLFQGYHPEHLAPSASLGKVELLVVGNVCRRDNPLVVEAERLGIPRMHVGDALQNFALRGTSPLVVTGTHGKTTTSTLLAHLLERTGLDPGYLVGGVPRGLAQSFKKAGPRRLPLGGSGATGRSVPFVLEGDEYDTAFWEKTPKFLHYGAEVAILTSIELDHIDIYPTWEAYFSQFERFVRELPESGLLVACASDPEVRKVAELARCPVAYYALEGEDTGGVSPEWLLSPSQETPSGVTFDLFVGGVSAGRWLSPLPGLYNVKNAGAAIAALAQGYGVGIKKLQAPLAEFQGVKRRQELRFCRSGVSVYDDFAHHPTAVELTLAGIRKKHPEGRLIAVFEPRSATACRKLHQEAYVRAFRSADLVLLAPLGRQNIPEEDRLDTAQLASSLIACGTQAKATSGVDEIVSTLCFGAEPKDTIVILSNGSFGGIFERLEAALPA